MNTLSRVRHFLAAITGAAILLAAGPAAAQQRPTIIVGFLGVTSTVWPALVARDKKFFEEAGINVDIVTTGASARSAQQVAAGVINVGSSSIVDTFRAVDGGGELKVFLNSQAVGTHSLIGGKTIKTIQDLKGKRVMTGGQKDITNLWWNATARHFGLDPAKDVELLFSGSTANRLAALMAGGVEASVISPPQSFKAFEDGYTDLGPVAPYMGEFPMMVWHVNTKWAQANPGAVTGFARAHNRAAAYMANPANRQETSEILAKATNSGLEDSLKTWDLTQKVKAYSPTGEIAPAVIQRVIEVLVADGDLKSPVKPAEAFYDDRYVKAAR